MKQILKNVLVVALLMLYGMGLGLHAANVGLTNEAGSNPLASSAYQAAITSSFVYHIPQAEATVSGSLPVYFHTLEDGGKYLAAVLPQFDFGLLHAFKQLQQFTVGLLVNLRKTDLLFPVHFFW